MRRTIIILVWAALITPLGFAQTSATTKQPTTTQPTTTTTYTAGTVDVYRPGKTIVVRSTQGPVSFALGAAARIVNSAGNVVTSALAPGQRVRVYYSGTGETRVVDRVMVEE